MSYDRILVDHTVMGGVPCVRETRIPVATVVGMVAEGMAIEEILSEFPQLSPDDVAESRTPDTPDCRCRSGHRCRSDAYEN